MRLKITAELDHRGVSGTSDLNGVALENQKVRTVKRERVRE